MKLILTITTILLPVSLFAEIYKWTDEQGNVHYGDSPQAKQAITVQVDEPSSIAGPGSESREEKRQRITDLLETDRLARKEARQKKDLEIASNRRECNRLRDKMKRYRKANSLYNLNNKGERVTLSNEQRQKSERSLQQRINKICQ